MATGLFNLKQVNQAISQGAWSGYIAPKWVEYLVVAGGGGGASGAGAGGGAGGLLTGIVTVAAGTSYTVTVGGGGVGAASGADAASGQNSLFGSISATGGGNGGTYPNNGGSGGSGGGGGRTTGATSGGSSVSGQGNAGGNVTAGGSNYGAAGGGGAGTAGLTSNGTIASNGGAGIASSITGSVMTYAGGGAGGEIVGYGYNGGIGGVGGGGSSVGNVKGGNGSPNTGGGGGGGAYDYGATPSAYGGGTGGSGIVVVRYPGNVQFYTGGAITYANGYIVHTFVASGTLAPTTPTVVTADYQISRSLRLNSADSAYLSRTPASASNRKTWTFSTWVKRTNVSSNQYFLSNLDSSGLNGFGVQFVIDGTVNIFDYGSSSYVYQVRTTATFLDPSAWYHFVIAFDTTQATSSNRVKFYVNNVQQTAFSVSNYPTLNYDGYWNNTSLATISRAGGISTQYFDGYVTETNFIDGQALTPSSFGATNANTGVWGPKAYTGTYGTNGFYVNFSDNSNTTAATLGKDYSGNGNNWTPNNFSVTAGSGNDSLVDSPTSYGTDYGVGGAVRGNYATLNPLNTAYTGKTLLNGNLDVTGSTLNQVGGHSTIQIPTTGQWYAECTMTATGGGSPFIGVNGGTTTLGASGASYRSDGTKELNGTGSAYGATWTTNDVIGIAVDTSAGSITFYKNGTSQGVAFTTLNTTFTTGLFFSCQGATGTASFTYNFGQRAFAYTPPGGFKALCTQNLPMPAIGTSPTTLATKYFNPVLYTGNGSARSITGVGFQPDLVWIKLRDTNSSNGWFDAVRGATKRLVSDTTAAEDTISGVTSFDSDGFSLGTSYNGSSFLYVAWNWRASNATAVSNTSGSITSTVSANTTSGFSIVTYTGTGALATVGHGLGVAPNMVIVKRRNGVADWATWHISIGTQVLFLDLTDAAVGGSAQWNGSVPTSSVFTVNTSSGVNGSGGTYVAYCFAPVAGFSAFGSYTGNGSTDGPFVFTGMRPAYIMVKRTDTGGTNMNWIIWDATRNTTNVVGEEVYANLNDAGTTYTDLDFVSNGFKIRNSTTWYNASGGTYIYMAFAQNPFKYSLAR